MGPLSVSISIRNDYRALEGPEEQMAKYEEFLLGVGAARNREMNYVEKLVLHLLAVSAQECLCIEYLLMHAILYMRQPRSRSSSTIRW